MPGESRGPRETLLEIYAAALAAVRGDVVVARHLQQSPIDGPVYVVAIGKAAQAMAEGAVAQLGSQIQAGLLISKYGHSASLAGFECIESGHPVPDENSLRAGWALLSFIDNTPLDAQLLFLISGGSSALVEVLADGLQLQDLAAVNQRMLGLELDIAQMNALRKRLSRIKGGRLAGYLQGRSATQLLISDVPGDDPAVIGSGLLIYPEKEEEGAAQAVAQRLGLELPLGCSDPVEQDFKAIQTKIVANRQDALMVAATRARAAGYKVVLADGVLQGETYTCSRQCVATLQSGSPGVYLWGGETSLTLPAHAGRGGRNQAFALQAALGLQGLSGCYLLAAGSDGSDGPTGDAGGLVDGETVLRGEAEGLDAYEALHHADAGTFLAQSGDIVNTGPTGTNVMDLVIALRI